MEIKKTPQNYASLQTKLIYTIANTTPRTFDVQIIDGNTEDVVGVKRLTGVTEGSVDAAPFLRHRLYFAPKTGPTGFASSTGRTVVGSIRVDDTNSSPLIFLPTAHTFVPPALLSTFGQTRQISRSAYEELTIWTETPCKIELTIRKGMTSQTTPYTAAQAGFVLFRLNTADFPAADAIQLHIVGVGTINYSFTDFRSGHRLAWRSSAGSIEHYTFPVEKESNEEINKEQTLTESGYHTSSIRSRRTVTLLSAYEPTAVLNPLTEILSSPCVWSFNGLEYTPIEVINATSGLRSHGTLHNLELHIAFPPQIQIP